MIADSVPPSFDTLHLQVEGAIAHLRLNRPERLNALSPHSMREITAACRWLATQDALRVLSFGGAGRAFCAGFDLQAMHEGRGRMRHEDTDLGRQMIDALDAIPAITLALVHSHCVGGGVLLAAACDLRIAADDARFVIPEMDLGIPLGWGGVPRLMRLVGPTLALELVLDCAPFDAAQALAWRFVNRVVPAAELDARGLAWAQRLALHPLNALRSTKQRFRAAADALCTTAGSEADADALLVAYGDAETLAVQQRYMARRRPA